MKYYFVKSTVNEDAMGGVSAPMATLTNTPGMGNATPASSAAMTGAQQTGSSTIGSGDKWGGDNMYAQNGKLKKKKKVKKVEEENINPYDNLGTSMAKKMKVPMTFKKKKSKTNTVEQKKFECVSETLDQYLNEEK